MAAIPFLGHVLDGYTPSLILAAAAVLLICWQKLSMQLDPAEPPLLKPTIPYIGHIIGILKHSTTYFEILAAKRPMPIATLPMINAKLYMVTNPALVQSAFRSKTLSFDPFMIEFAQKMLGVSDATMIPIKDLGDEKRPAYLDVFVREIHGAMVGKYLHKMNADALNEVAITINGLGKSFEAESLYLWLRDMMTMATCNALLGSHNPMKDDPSLVDALWNFEGGIMNFILGIPEIFAPKAYKGRRDLQAALIKYYTAKYDQNDDVAQMTKARANVYRSYNISSIDIGKFELALIHVSTANAIPTLFWHLCFICSDPKTTAAIREELLTMIATSPAADGKRQINIDITKFETHAPLLVSSYRETIRLANSQVGTRRAIADTVISDGKSSYLLRKGADVQMPAGVTQTSTAIWGPNATSFDPRRFMKSTDKMSDKEKDDDREQKRAYFPFGGGKHLCPGRNFAFAEILGAVAVVLLGFDVQGLDGDLIVVPELGRAQLGEGVAKPRGDGAKMGAKLVRRKGWEDVEWKFSC